MTAEGVAVEIDRMDPSMPFLEWRFGEEAILKHIEELAQIEEPALVLVECAYHMGYFQEAAEAAEAVARKGSEKDRMVALCIEVYARLAMADAAGAQRAFELARSTCLENLSPEDDSAAYGASIICTRLLEDVTRLELLSPNLQHEHYPDLPDNFQAFYGYQLAYRILCAGEYQQAIGMARAFLIIANNHYPLSRIKLWLVIAAANLRIRKPAEAERAFMKAWDLANPLGIVGPFVEMSASLPGLMRHCLYDDDRKSFQALRSMTGTYRSTWHQLRRRLNCPIAGDTLSALEYSTATLAAWQWSNREIASFLGIAESTVKHYLSNAYQKLGVKSRSELIALAKLNAADSAPVDDVTP